MDSKEVLRVAHLAYMRGIEQKRVWYVVFAEMVLERWGQK